MKIFTRLCYTVVLFLSASLSFGQTDPNPQSLPYTFTGFAGSETTLPDGIAAHRFGTTAATIPTTRTTIVANGDLNNASGASGGWHNESADGIGILASGSQAAGAIVVAINTENAVGIKVSWIGRVITATGRDVALGLQYRVGNTGSWTNLGTDSLSTTGKAVGDSAVFTTNLPSSLENLPVVQLRWIYWQLAGTGSRKKVAVDDIQISKCIFPVVNLGNDTSYCAGSSFSLTLDAGNAGATYAWSGDASGTAQTFDVTAAGTYVVEVTEDGCSATDTLVVSEITIPVVDLGGGIALCAGDTLTLDAGNAGATYAWSGDASGTAQTFDVTAAGTYIVEVTLNGCSVNDTFVVSSVVPFPVVDLGNDTSYCAGSPFSLTLDAGNVGLDYTWSGDATGTNQTFDVTVAGTYIVEVTDNGCSTKDTIEVAEIAVPVVALGNDTSYCAGSSFSLTLDAGNAGATYAWGGDATGAAQTFDVTAAGTYVVEVVVDGCSAVDTLVVSEVALPLVNLGNDTSVCQGDTLILDAGNPGASYIWTLIHPLAGAQQLPFTTQTIAYPVPTAFSIVAQVTLNGCSATDTIGLTEAPVPTVSLGSDASYCAGAPFELTLNAFNAGATYLWSDASTEDTLAVDTAGIYWVEVTLGSCVATDTIVVTEVAYPVVNLGNDTTICSANALTLNAGTADAYNWSTGETTATISVNTTGQYWVEASNASCTTTDTIDVNVVPSPSVSLGNDTSYCAGATFELTLNAFNAGATYLWSNTSTEDTLAVDTAGVYWVEVTLGSCVATDTIVVTEVAYPVVDLGNDTTICSANALTLNAGSADAYNWSTGETTATISVNAAGQYWVEASNGACVTTDTIEVAVTQSPVANLGADLSYCAGATFSDTLDAGLADSYLWSDGSSDSTLVVDTAGVYWVTITVNGCDATDTLVVVEIPAPSVDLGSDTLEICSGSPVTLDAGPGYTYTWMNGSPSQTLVANSPGTYWVIVNGITCPGTASDTIEVVVKSSPIVNLGNDTSYCVGASFSHFLDIQGNLGATYLWDDASFDSTRTIDTAGVYYVTVTGANGCVSTDTITVLENVYPVVSLGNDTALCGTSYVLDAGNATTYLWSTGEDTQTITVTSSDTFWVEVANGTCTSSDTVIVELFAVPVVSLGADTGFCAGSGFSITLFAGNADTYLWSDASAADSLEVTAAGTYWVEVTNGGICTVTDTIVISEYALPVVNLGNDTGYCAGSSFSLVLDAGNAGSTYSWNGGTSSGQTFTATSQGSYNVTVTTANGCVASDALVVTQYAVPSVNLGADVSTNASSHILDAGAGHTSYTWTPGGQTTQTITVTANGTYTVTVANAQGCTATDNVNVTFTASINEADMFAFNLFPNPAVDNVTFTVNYQGTLVMDITNVSGQRIFTERVEYVNGNAVTIDLANFASGMYFIRLSGEKLNVVKPFVVK